MPKPKCPMIGRPIVPGRAGYSFAEILFAVAILGVGFIMVAAMFPVAISQSKATAEETRAAALAAGMAEQIKSIATSDVMPVTADIVPFSGVAGQGSWTAVRGMLINSTDPRYAVIPMYRRVAGNSAAQVWLFVVRVQARPEGGDHFSIRDITMGPVGFPTEHANLQPRPLFVETADDPMGTGIDEIMIRTPTAGSPPKYADAVTDGAMIMITDSGNAAALAKLYRVGQRRPDRDTAYDEGNATTIEEVWELLPGGDLGDPAEEIIPGMVTPNAYVIGRSMTVSGDAFGGYTGLPQEVERYEAMVLVN